ncbi:helix-turn-helix domain-containing protein [Flavobacterium sp.]|uniref:helix-turn-helix domain-containing protein n=1 Tax=Flavobacterium sp. TaxID=239 RepID=UPI003752C51B
MHESLDDIERYLIKRVKELREKKGLSQVSLSLALGKSTTFISDIEAPSKKAKYNVKHLNDIAKIFECSPKDFWPEKPL